MPSFFACWHFKHKGNTFNCLHNLSTLHWSHRRHSYMTFGAENSHPPDPDHQLDFDFEFGLCSTFLEHTLIEIQVNPT